MTKTIKYPALAFIIPMAILLLHILAFSGCGQNNTQPIASNLIEMKTR